MYQFRNLKTGEIKTHSRFVKKAKKHMSSSLGMEKNTAISKTISKSFIQKTAHCRFVCMHTQKNVTNAISLQRF